MRWCSERKAAHQTRTANYQMSPELVRIRNLLHDLGLTENSISFYYIDEAVRLALDDPTRLLLVTKRLYPETARTFRTSWRTVERGIRYSIGKLWASNPEHIQKVLEITTAEKPVPSVFLSLLCACLQRTYWFAASEEEPEPAAPDHLP